MRTGNIPLLPPYGKSASGDFYNLNADVAAAHVAEAVQADRLIFLTDVPGVYADFEAGTRLLDTTPQELRQLMASGSFTSGMIPKVTAMLYAAERDIPEVWVVDGRNADSVQFALGLSMAEEPRDRGTKLSRSTEEAHVF